MTDHQDSVSHSTLHADSGRYLICFPLCICGEGEQEVEHVLFNCKNKEIIPICEHFEDRYCRHVKNFKAKPVSSKSLEILNVIPNCHISDREKAKSLICTFVKKHIYITLKKINV